MEPWLPIACALLLLWLLHWWPVEEHLQRVCSLRCCVRCLERRVATLFARRPQRPLLQLSDLTHGVTRGTYGSSDERASDRQLPTRKSSVNPPYATRHVAGEEEQTPTKRPFQLPSAHHEIVVRSSSPPPVGGPRVGPRESNNASSGSEPLGSRRSSADPAETHSTVLLFVE